MSAQTQHENPNASISEVVKHLLMLKHMSREGLADQVGMSSKSLARRLRQEMDWSATEVAQVAAIFDAPVEVFYAGPKGLFTISTMLTPWPALAAA